MTYTPTRYGSQLLLLLLCLGMGLPSLAADQRTPSAATNPTTNTDQDISNYQRFVSYPHLEKGLKAYAEGDLNRAIEELAQAHKLAPQSRQIALQYAIALDAVGQRRDAQAVLSPWIKDNRATPDMQAAYRQMSLSQQKADLAALADSPDVAAFRTRLARVDTQFTTAYDESVYLSVLAASPHVSDAALLDYPLRFPSNQNLRITQRLVLYQNNPAATRAFLIQARSQLPTDTALLSGLPLPIARGMAQSCIPLPSPQDRSMQIEMLKDLQDCDCLRAQFLPYQATLSARDWANLSQCYPQVPGLAESAAQHAADKQPSATHLKQLAYAAYQTDDFAIALAAWQQVPATAMSTQDHLAAQTTAIAASDFAFAEQQTRATIASGAATDQRFFWNSALIAIHHEDWPMAITALNQANQLHPTAMAYEKLGWIEAQRGDSQAAQAAYAEAARLAPDDSQIQSGLGYAAYHAEDYEQAQTAFTAALKGRPDDVAVQEQLAYVHQKQGNNPAAIHYSQRAIDDYQRRSPDELNERDINTQFGLRRMNEDLARRWSFTLDGAVSNHQTPLTGSPQPGLAYRNYWQAEAAYRLGDMGIDNGRTFSAYTRLFSGNGTDSTVLPINSPMLGIGLRWKPFTEQIINLAVEQQIPLDHVQQQRDNTLLRISGSFFNTGRFSDDWHPTGNGWMAQNLYLDGAYYLANSLSSMTADYRVSYHHKIFHAETLEPYAHVQWNTLNQVTGDDARLGVGLRWNLWRNDDKYNAYASRYFLGVEFQHAFTTYLNDKNALLVMLGIRL